MIVKEIDQSTSTGEPDPRRTSKKKRLLFIAITIFVGLFLGLVVFEFGLRIIGYSSPDFFIPDETFGYTLVPNMSGAYHKEGKSFVQINSDGFRDVERQAAKPPGVYRIAVIGDSFVEAMQVSTEESFLRYARDEAIACGAFDGRQIEVLNFGVSGYGTAQELLVMREKVWKYSPDLVVLLVTTNNDITDNSPVFRHNPIPYFVYRDGVLTLDDSFRSSKKFIFQNSRVGRLGIWLKNHLRIVQAIGEIDVALKNRYTEWKQPPLPNVPAANAPAPAVPVTELGIENEIYREPADENWKDAWKVTEGLIGTMKTEAEVHGAKFLVIAGSNGVQVLPSLQERGVFMRAFGVEDLFYPDRRIAGFCESNAIPVIRLAPVLAEYAARENVYLHGFTGNMGYGHWNQAGHRVAGQEIGKRLCEGVLR